MESLKKYTITCNKCGSDKHYDNRTQTFTCKKCNERGEKLGLACGITFIIFMIVDFIFLIIQEHVTGEKIDLFPPTITGEPLTIESMINLTIIIIVITIIFVVVMIHLIKTINKPCNHELEYVKLNEMITHVRCLKCAKWMEIMRVRE